MSLPRPWTLCPNTRSTAASTPLPGTKPPSTSATAWPPAGSATRSWSLTTGRLSRKAPTTASSPTPAGNIMRCGTPRHSTIPQKTAIPKPQFPSMSGNYFPADGEDIFTPSDIPRTFAPLPRLLPWGGGCLNIPAAHCPDFLLRNCLPRIA